MISKESYIKSIFCVKEVAIYKIKIKTPLKTDPNKEPRSDNISAQRQADLSPCFKEAASTCQGKCVIDLISLLN